MYVYQYERKTDKKGPKAGNRRQRNGKENLGVGPEKRDLGKVMDLK